MRYTFTFDAASCTGCKACQVACKDKNQLPPGVLWRRVYEISGGSWQQHGNAWTNTVFAYNVSVGCNHCAEPACAAACPTGAYEVRDNGIVVQRAEQCIGCQYCAWACPYGAPQYSADAGRISKCDCCQELMAEGLLPVCVAACPMRALDIVETRKEAEGPRRVETQRLPFPLSSTSARPSVVIKPHPAMLTERPKAVANYEEVRPRVAALARGLGEWPLVAFTLLGQAAAGLAVWACALGMLSRAHELVGVLLAAAALASLLHLGTARRAWRAPANLRHSALSREIVMLGLFAAAWALAWAAPAPGGLALALTAVGLVESMTQVYDLEAVPDWAGRRSRVAFATSALVLGGVALVLLRLAASPNAIGTLVGTALAAAAMTQQVISRRRFYQKTTVKLM